VTDNWLTPAESTINGGNNLLELKNRFTVTVEKKWANDTPKATDEDYR
jgi:hypothetical protein